MAGRVLDEGDLQPVGGMTVTVEGTTSSTQTDARGRFVLADVPRRPFELRVDGHYYEPVWIAVDGNEPPEDLEIRVSHGTDTDHAVQVTATRVAPATATSMRISRRQIDAIPKRSAEDLLRVVPGLTLVQHGSEGKGQQYFLRGFDAVHGSDIEIRAEGIPINEWSNIHAQGYLDLGSIIPEAVRAVDVVKGPFTLRQGAFAMAGSANYRLGVDPNALGTRTTYTAGTTNRHRGVVTHSPVDGDGRDVVALEALHDRSFGERRSVTRAAGMARWRLFDDHRGELALVGLGHLARFSLPGIVRDDDFQLGRIDFRDSYQDDQRGQSGRAIAALQYDYSRADNRVRASAFAGYRRLFLRENFTGFLIDPENGDGRQQEQTAVHFGADLDLHRHLNSTWGVEVGAGVQGDVLRQRQEHVGFDGDRLDVERELAGVQAMLHIRGGIRWQPTSSIEARVGLRGDLTAVRMTDGVANDNAGASLLTASPRASVRWSPTKWLGLFSAYGRGFRPPEARSFSSFQPERLGLSEDLFDGGEPRATVSDAFEVGVRWQPARNLRLTTAGFATFIERESVFDHVSGINVELNRTRRLGVEGELALDLTPWLSLSADVTWVDARFVDSNNPIPLAPQLVGSGRVIATHPSGWRAAASISALSARPLPHGARGAARAVVDLSGGYAFSWGRFDVEVENLLNRKLRDGEYHFASAWERGRRASEIPVLHYAPGAPLNARLTVTVAWD